MKYFIVLLYKHWLVLRLKPVLWHKLAAHLILGVIVGIQLTPNLYAQTESSETNNTALPIATNYLSTSGFIDGREAVTVLAQPYHWPTITHRLSRGVSPGHRGLDIDGEFSDPIFALTNGLVVFAGYDGAYGQKILIQHPTDPHNYSTVYAHLQSIAVVTGQTVTTGQYLGAMGSTGRSSGSHLHFEVIEQGHTIDPARLF